MRMNVSWPNGSSTILNAMPTNGLVGSGSSGNFSSGSSHCLALTLPLQRRGQIAHDRIQQRLHCQNDPDALIDFRMPRFDLDSVYGRGPDDQPYLYADGRQFLLGDALTGNALGQALNAHDLPRSSRDSAGARDHRRPSQRRERHRLSIPGTVPALPQQGGHRQPRTELHRCAAGGPLPLPVVVAQRLPARRGFARGAPRGAPAPHQNSNIHLHPPQLLFYQFHNDMFMPLEFSAAAYRFGHSMVRPGYRLNDDVGPFAIFPLAPTCRGPGPHRVPRVPTQLGYRLGPVPGPRAATVRR